MKRSIALVLALTLGACATPPMEPNYYLLRSDATITSGALEPSREFALGQISIAPYIDQPGLLLETAPGEVRAARYHLWAEPVRDGIETFLRQEISRRTGENLLPGNRDPGRTTINVRIDQMHGTLDGQARLVAYWWLSSGGVMTSAHRFAESLPLDTPGYAALASAEKALLARFAASIGDAMATGAEPAVATDNP